MVNTNPAQASLFDRLGGMKAINRAVDVFYAKITADPHVSPYFSGITMPRLRAKQKAFLAMVLGGPNAYTGRNLRDAHRPLVQRGLDDSHLDRVITLLGETLLELGAAPGDVDEVAAIANSVRDEILDR